MFSSILFYAALSLVACAVIYTSVRLAEHVGKDDEDKALDERELSAVEAAKHAREKLAADPKARAELDKKYERD